MKTVKLVVVLVLSILLIMVVVRNTEQVETDLLLFRTELPVIVLLFVTTAGGFALGLLVSFLVRKKDRAKEEL